MTKPVIVIMAGGRGERFWPLSRRRYPKQLLKLVGERSLLQETVARITPLTEAERILIVVNQDYSAAVREQLPFLPERNILVEPQGRNTAVCIGLAAAYCAHFFPGEDPALAFLPSDAWVSDPAALRHSLAAGLAYSAIASGGIIFGIRPTRPETGYGYIQLGREMGQSQGVPFYQVAAFKEKPDRATAARYFKSNEYLWNGGIFLWRLSILQQQLAEHLPELAVGIKKLQPHLGAATESSKLAELYPRLAAVSFDYGVLEKSKDLVVFPVSFGWDDLGSWSSLGRLLKQDESGNRVHGEHLGVNTSNCVIYSPQKLVATLGVKDLIIVASDDVVLVCHPEQAQEIKQLLAELAARGREDLL